jgi:hypothetical protein
MNNIEERKIDNFFIFLIKKKWLNTNKHKPILAIPELLGALSTKKTVDS